MDDVVACPECRQPFADITAVADTHRKWACPTPGCSVNRRAFTPVMSHTVAARLLEALGISARNVTALSLELGVNDVVRVKLECLPTIDGLVQVERIVREFELVPSRPITGKPR